MKKRLLMVIVVLVSVAIGFSSCFVERSHGYGGYDGGGYPHKPPHHHHW